MSVVKKIFGGGKKPKGPDQDLLDAQKRQLALAERKDTEAARSTQASLAAVFGNPNTRRQINPDREKSTLGT